MLEESAMFKNSMYRPGVGLIENWEDVQDVEALQGSQVCGDLNLFSVFQPALH